jgi:DNA replication initiation complex subunit (GINS family)
MPKDELNCEKLRQILEIERMQKIRKNRLLTEIEPEFYSNLANYLNGLQKAFEDEYKVNPTSPKTMLLRDELNKAKSLSENIFGIREEKIVMATLSAIKGGKPDLKCMVNEEKMLYRHLLNVLKENREQIFSTESKIKPAPKTVPLNEHKPEPGYLVVRALDNLSFVGSDEKEYNLIPNDVVSLPKDTALLLCKTGNVKEITIYQD